MLPRERPRDLLGSVCGDTMHATPGESSLALGAACAGTGPACFPENFPRFTGVACAETLCMRPRENLPWC